MSMDNLCLMLKVKLISISLPRIRDLKEYTALHEL